MATFDSLHGERKAFLSANRAKDFVVTGGTNKVLISAPHGVPQTRLGKMKMQEPGSLATALALKNNSDCYFIAKTKNNFDDANFDEVSAYKNAIAELAREHKIKYLLDIHGLAKSRPCDINLGINFGKNVSANIPLFDKLVDMLRARGFKTEIDFPFKGGETTIAGSIKGQFPEMWTIQIEINCAITSERQNIKKWNGILECLLSFIREIERA